MRNQWYVAALAADLKRKPLPATILGERIVLFRDETGTARALADRCPHRNVQLSLGKVEDGRLHCAYHGWQFDGQGQCVGIPSLCAGDRIPKGSQVPSYPLVEQDGYLWVFMGESPEGLPYRIPHVGERGWGDSRIEATIPNAVDNVIENFIDCCHTGYVHGGLFRTPACKDVQTRVQQVEDGIVIEIDEEAKTDSLLARLLIPKGGKVVHVDRFIMPSIVKVSYEFGSRGTIIGHQICTPVGEFETRVFVHVAWNLGVLTPLITPFVPIVGRIILNQDMGVLINQAEQLQRQPATFVSTPADTANLWIHAFRKKHADGPSPTSDLASKDVRFRL